MGNRLDGRLGAGAPFSPSNGRGVPILASRKLHHIRWLSRHSRTADDTGTATLEALRAKLDRAATSRGDDSVDLLWEWLSSHPRESPSQASMTARRRLKRRLGEAISTSWSDRHSGKQSWVGCDRSIWSQLRIANQGNAPLAIVRPLLRTRERKRDYPRIRDFRFSFVIEFIAQARTSTKKPFLSKSYSPTIGAIPIR